MIDAGTGWLALEVLHSLGKLLPLPFSLPAETRFHLERQLEPALRAELAQQAQLILQSVQNALRGRDAYFPPEQPVSDELVKVIRAALATEQEMLVDYGGLGDKVPRERRLEPHWLEKGEGGIYLHAYCYLAEANRVFRLDRIHGWQLIRKE